MTSLPLMSDHMYPIQVKVSRVVIHLQLLEWPLSGTHSSPAQLLSFIGEVLSFHKSQRNLSRPIVVHCLGGVGRSGVFCLLSAAIKEIAAGNALLDILGTAIKLSQSRKFAIQEKEQFKFCYDVLLYHAQDLLIKRGILTSMASFGGKSLSPAHVRHPSEDFVLGPGTAPKGATEELPPKEQVSTEASKVEDAVTQLLDPASFTLDRAPRQKMTKESFKAVPGTMAQSDPKDPLSQLDPLWSLKRSKE